MTSDEERTGILVIGKGIRDDSERLPSNLLEVEGLHTYALGEKPDRTEYLSRYRYVLVHYSDDRGWMNDAFQKTVTTVADSLHVGDKKKRVGYVTAGGDPCFELDGRWCLGRIADVNEVARRVRKAGIPADFDEDVSDLIRQLSLPLGSVPSVQRATSAPEGRPAQQAPPEDALVGVAIVLQGLQMAFSAADEAAGSPGSRPRASRLDDRWSAAGFALTLRRELVSSCCLLVDAWIATSPSLHDSSNTERKDSSLEQFRSQLNAWLKADAELRGDSASALGKYEQANEELARQLGAASIQVQALCEKWL